MSSTLLEQGGRRRAPRRLRTPDLFGGRAGSGVAAQKLLGGTFLAAVGIATIGETRGGLPTPRRYAAIVLLWFIFGLAAELGGQVARFVGALAALVTLAMAMGKAGQRALGWVGQTSRELQAQPTAAAEALSVEQLQAVPAQPRPGGGSGGRRR